MSICENAIQQLMQYLSQAVLCGPNEANYEVVRTPFFYPDRDNIELYLRELNDGQVLLSDLGQTIIKLSQYGFTPHSSPRRRAMIFQIVSSLNVRYENGSIQAISRPETIGSRVWDLLLAIQRLSDLVFTVPGYTKATFPDEFESYIIERTIQYQRGIQIALNTGYKFNADFIIQGNKVVQLLSAGSSGYARERANRVYVDFSEMKIAADVRPRLAVVDDTQHVWDNILDPLTHQADGILYWTRKADLGRALVESR